MFIKTLDVGFHFGKDSIAKIEELKNAKYMGYWCTKNPRGGWNEAPVDIFYVANPDRSQGHSNYFGMFRRDESVFITNGESAFSEPMVGVLLDDGEVIVSRYRHDYVERGDKMIDGGRDYTRSSGGPFVEIMVVADEFLFEPIKTPTK